MPLAKERILRDTWKSSTQSTMASRWSSPCGLLVVATFLGLSNGCGSGSGSTSQVDGTGQAATPAPYGRGGRVVTEAELEELRKDHSLVPTDQPSKDSQTQLDENLAAASGYLRNHPEAAQRLAPAIQNVRAGAGTGPHTTTLTTRSGKTKTVLLMDDFWKLNSTLKWMAVVETQSNQLSVFKVLKHQFPDGHLPDHTTLPTEDEAARMSAEDLIELNKTLTGQQSSSGAEGAEPTAGAAYTPLPAGFTRSAPLGYPTREYGVNWGMDLESLNVNTSQFGYAPNGIMRFALQQFPHTAQYTPNFSNVTSVKDQGPRGTCTAFATVSAMEAAAMTNSTLPTNLSEQALYGFALLGSPSAEDGYNSGDYLNMMANGSYSAAPYETWWDYNPAIARWTTGSTPPYADSCDGYGKGCSDTTAEDPLVCTSSQCYYEYPLAANNGVTVTNSSALVLPTAAAMLQLGFPVILEFAETPDFESPDISGYVTYTGNGDSLGGHAVHAVGYLTNAQLAAAAASAGITDVPTAAGGGFFVIKNSWGDWFGDGGYVYVPYSYFDQNLTAVYSINAIAFVGVIPGIPSGLSSRAPSVSLPSPSLALGSGAEGSFVISNVGTAPTEVYLAPENPALLALITGPSASSHTFILTPGWSYAQWVAVWENTPPGSYSTGVAMDPGGVESVSYTVPKPRPAPIPCVNPHEGCKP